MTESTSRTGIQSTLTPFTVVPTLRFPTLVLLSGFRLTEPDVGERGGDVTRSHEEKLILWAAIEDYAGFWELEWELNSAGEAERSRERAQRVVAELVGQRSIEVFPSDWQKEQVGDALPTDEALRVASDDANWEPPSSNDAVIYVVSATSAGKQRYEEYFEPE